MLKILYEDTRYRHENYWKLFVRFSGAVLALAVIPFLYQKDYGFLRQIYWVFPLFGVLVAAAAWVILRAEYSRIEAAGRNIVQLRDELGYPRTGLLGGFMSSIHIGVLVNWVFALLSISTIAISYFVFRYVVLTTP